MREERQKEAMESYLSHVDGKTIINACPRFGKIKVAIDIIKAKGYHNILVFMPRRDIAQGWLDDHKKFRCPGVLEGCTFASIKKQPMKNYDLVIIDEPHELSANQQEALKPWVKKYPILGLTGTMTQKTRKELYNSLDLDVCYTYSINQGVEEGILADYVMHIHKVPLDTKSYYCKTSSGKNYTEKGYFDLYQYVRKTSKKKHFIDMKLINIIQNSISKRDKTIQLLNDFRDERVLVFCGVTAIADQLSIPVYHSKAKEKDIFLDFCVGGGSVDQLATIKMMQAGITVNPINRGIINYMSGNPEDSAQKICRFLGLEYDNLSKKADIHIITTTEEFELERLKTGLGFFDESKIIYP